MEVPYVDLPKQGGGHARFTDIEDTTATAADVINKKYFYTADGTRTQGTGQGGSINLQTKTVTPSETQTTVTADNAYDGLSSVTVKGITPSYVGSGVTQRSSTDLTVSGATISAPAGYYSATASKSIATTSRAIPTIAVNASGLITATVTQSTGYVTAGTTAATLQLTTQAGKTVTPSQSAQTAVASGRYVTGTVTVAPIPSDYIVPEGTIAISSNGTEIDVSQYAYADVAVPTGGGVNNQNKTVTPTESKQTIAPDSGYTGLGTVTVNAIPTDYIGSGITQRSSTDLTVSGATVTAPAGYYSAAASKSVAAGTAGTPSATKGTVSNHAISVTPKVTNTTGYITGGTKTGTAVTISASELVSGTLNITSNGTKDVTNYATVSVAVPVGASINNQDKTITPTETVQTIEADSGYTGLGTVTVAAISSAYVGSSITRRTSSDLTGSLQTSTYDVTAPAGYYNSNGVFSIPRRSASNITTSVSNGYLLLQYDQGYYPAGGKNLAQAMTQTDLTISGDTVIVPAGYYAEQASKSIGTGNITAPTITVDSETGEISASTKINQAGYLALNTTRSSTSQLTTQAAKTVTPTKATQTAVSSGTYVTGDVKVGPIPNDYLIPTGTITISSNSTGIDVSTYATANVSVAAPTPNLQNKTITPSETQQTVSAGSGYDGLGTVTVAAITPTYIGSGITQRTSSSLTKSGATVTAPAGYYASNASISVDTMTLPTTAASSATTGYTSKATISRSASDQYINIAPGYNSAGGYYKISAVANGSSTMPATISGSSASLTTGTNTLTLTKTISATPVVNAGYISAGTAGNVAVTLTASVTTKAAATITPGTSNQTIASGTYLTGTQTIAGDSDLTAANIKNGVQIFGVTGSYTSDATASAADIVSGKTGYVNGSKITGNLVVQKYYTGSSTPSSSLGNDGDIYVQS